MLTLLLVGLAGFLAQLVSGTLGMGYGMTATTALVVFGTAPAIASASAHFAQVGTSLASGVSHWRFRNVDWRAVGILAGPGSVGAVIGAVLLVSFSADFATAWMSVILFALGVYVLVRFAFLRVGKLITEKRPGVRFLAPLGLVAGFVDATGGGGWGPISTTALVSAGRTAPRTVIGSVDTSEFLVSLAASLGFLFSLGHSGIRLDFVLALLAGGLVAAPVAAWLVSRIPAQVMGSLVGGFVILTNLATLFGAFDVPAAARLPITLSVLVAWAAAVAVGVRRLRRDRAQRPVAEPELVDA